MQRYLKALLLIPIILIFLYQESKGIEPCDSLRWCVGRTLKFKVSSGKGAHYIDVANSDLLNKLGETMTVEMWLKPAQQSGNTQYICGLWGPGEEKNDSWAVYITADDTLKFELNGLGNLGSEDNTVVKTYAGNLYGAWNHYSFIFDGKTGLAYIYINAAPVATGRNGQYPLNRLRKISNDELSIQLGSTNAVSNNNDNRTYLGDMDEIRIWGRALSPTDLNCLKNKALGGKEDSLLLYYRCNDPAYIYTLCDVTGHGNFGLMRSGLSTEWSDRRDQVKIVLNPLSITDTVYCDSEKTYDFTVRDTTLCATGAYFRINSAYPEKFRLSLNNKEYPMNNWVYVPLTPNTPISFKIRVICDFIGTVTSTFEVRNSNACGWNIANIPISITRFSELNISKLRVDFDSLKARCIEKPYIDSVLRICNSTNNSSSPRNVTVSRLSVKMPNVYSLSYPSLPRILKPGECMDINVRFFSRDTSAVYRDTIKVESDDKCAQLVAIPLNGKVKEVIGLWKDGSKRLDSIDFGKSCLNFPSAAVEYDWENLIETNITVTDIIIPSNFIGKPFRFPVLLAPKTGYNPNYFRFLPKQKGVFVDSIIFVIKSDGCTIRRPVYVKGTGYDAAISFESASVDFGTVIVGQQATLNVKVRNDSDDPLLASIYLKQGDPFYLTGAKNVNISPNSSATFPMTFIPTKAGSYNDYVCLYENSCYQSFCIPVKGTAIVQRFAYIPEVMEVLNVLGCETKDTVLEIKNISGQTQTLSNFSIAPPVTPFILLDPPTLPASVTLNDQQSVKFSFRYNPNDIANDRADRAFLHYKTSDGEAWSGKLYGTSVIPKMYLTEEVLYPTIEVGGRSRDTLNFENISAFDIMVDSMSISNGFEIIYPAGFSGRIFKPRDSMMIIVDFVPAQDQLYTGELTIYSSGPCPSVKKSELSGRGIIVPLDAPLKVISYGFIKPCECEVRTIPMINNSFNFSMSIDSIWIDSLSVTNPSPEFYSWYSFYSPGAIVPYSIPPRSTDTLSVKFCPKRPFDYSLVDNDARLHIRASGNGWSNEFTTYLSGKQTLLFAADSQRVIFAPTRVDTFARSQYLHLEIPELRYNPQRAAVKVNALGFSPEERVFYAEDSLSGSLPFMIDTSGRITLKLDFKPRAVRSYEAKLRVDIETPCVHFDTSVTVIGSGFAPAFGLDFNFDNQRKARDTFRFPACDTLEIPVYSSREIPANLVDVFCRLGYDTTKLEYLGASSEYLFNPCDPYVPDIKHNYSTYGGSEFLLKNFCRTDSLKPLFIARFLAKNSLRDTFDITVDSIKFDTEEVILYHLIAESDIGTIIILQPELTAINQVNFDSVRVLDCSQRTIQLRNTGDMPLNLFSMLDLPKEIKIISSQPPLTDTLDVGDTISITLEYCPRKKENLDRWLSTGGWEPCFVLDSNKIDGIGFTPEFPVYFDLSQQFYSVDTLRVQLGDTLTIPIFTERDFSAEYQGKTYWLEALNFISSVAYDPFALKFLEARNYTRSDLSYTYTPGLVKLEFRGTDSLMAGKIAEVDFLSVVPDTVETLINISAGDFNTDSVMFLDIIPLPTQSVLISLGKCNITNLNYTGVEPMLWQNSPNPWNYSTEILFDISEKGPVHLEIYSMDGRLVRSSISGQEFGPGKYRIIVSGEGLSTGAYYYTLRTRTNQFTRSMMLVR